MNKTKNRKQVQMPLVKNNNVNILVVKKKRIEYLKRMINNEDYISEAISKLANSLTSGLMK